MKVNKLMLLVPIVLISALLILVACDNRSFEPEELPSYTIHSMTAMPDVIYADNNITTSQIKVVVRKEETSAASNITVRFLADIGGIINYTTTDSMGIAVTDFYDSGEQGIATIEARAYVLRNDVEVLVASEVISVTIEAVPEVNSLNLNINAEEFPVNEVTMIQSQAFYANNLPVPDGTMITMETTKGFFQSDLEGTSMGNYLILSTQNGTVSTYWNTGTQSTPVSDPALVTAKVALQEVENEVSILPGDPRWMTLTPDVTEIEAGSNTNINIEALVKDTYGNPVLAGIGVEFSFEEDSELGTLNPTLVPTDEFGLCSTSYSPGNVSGTAIINAVADSANTTTAITIMSDEVSSIEFDFDGVVDIYRQGSGGDESFEAQVNLKDMNGNPIDYEIPVFFKFLYGPEGINMTNGEDTVIIEAGQTSSPYALEIVSNNGIALVAVNSGSVSGTVELQAYCFNEAGDEISAQKTNIVVHSGAPNSVSVSHDNCNDGIDVGAGFWDIEIGAFLTDDVGNPVDYGTAVHFSFPNGEPWASLSTYETYTGNENADGDSLIGVTYTNLTYSGIYTNDELDLKVQSGEFEEIVTIVLPIQNPEVNVIITPSHIYWQQGVGNTNDRIVEMTVYVADGQQNPISNQLVHFTIPLGHPSENQGDNQGEYYGITDEDGYIHKFWVFEYFEVPDCVPPAWSATITVQMEATILECGGTDNATLTIIKYCPPPLAE
jgi:hypothetical protein